MSSDAILNPLTEDQIKAHKAQRQKLEDDAEMMKSLILRVLFNFQEIETALSCLFNTMLNLNPVDSKVAYVIYYSPKNFNDRLTMTNAVLIKIIEENPDLNHLLQKWNYTKEIIDKIHRLRNEIAHKIPTNCMIRNKTYVRLIDPPFKPQTVTDQMAAGKLPGLGIHDLEERFQKFNGLIESIDDINSQINSFYKKIVKEA